ncbi:hypothetical protein FJO69_01825 [[Mycoplasma] falconis]|uniref:YqaJ viral recombinase domain-containing protein n=1 Tax=[Mycoplasma] falconis TaxID=92403 RepID=A0A501XAG5_9BACT|nr:hypothetical protein [[Mycoplasma] falconis]TPE57347.1 hypothetical protein FJO69_01825 [[Mycoplasma] falconis]
MNIIIPDRKGGFNGVNYDLDFVNKRLVIKPEILGKKINNKIGTAFGLGKITGSSIGDILQVEKFSSPFAAFTRIFRCALPVLDPKYINAGVALEPKILAGIEKKLNVEIKRYPAHEYNYDYFKENKLFGGLPDGYIEKDHLVVEIKTSGAKNLENWDKFGLPVKYIKQAMLYTHLMGEKDFIIVACFLEENDYINPYEVDVKTRKVKSWKFYVNEPEVLDDMQKCQHWYDEYVLKGISPTWNEETDQDLIDYLACQNQEEWQQLYLKWVREGKAVPQYEK